MSTVTTESKSQRAYEWLRERIQRREFGPGYRLVLGSVAQALDMSVVPVREAIRRLEAEGLVEFERNVGARVSLVDRDEYAHSMQTLGVVEGIATALAAPLLTPADLDRAEAVNARLIALLDDFDPIAFTRLNREFHSILFEPCPNPHIVDLVHRGWTRLHNLLDSSFAFVPGRAPESVREHARILELLRAGAAPIEIELAARQHRWGTMNAYLAETDPTTQERA
ncbi:GntR family transcriptional regulator [Microbacterium paludicola]|uniref:GntR family transcriptional regulator n=1 Tax=Microbacterium paludicola TaxID=300019 RepID=A0A4Y9FTV5_9MICO|nr:GntR family transcriptional regulator [Microbacterium paludicola]MBF0816592.1 GntR family transcriptional regulator [Microbacterium paludicola]TFU32679.1 GntR family transcriptional regulator [Microbacterium paludicola]